MLSHSLAAVLEVAINQWLLLDKANARKALPPLQGKAVAVHLDEFDLPLHFIFSSKAPAMPVSKPVIVSAHHEHPADLTIRATLLHLIRLSMAEDNSRYLLEHPNVQIQGSLVLAELFSQLLHAVDLDWEQALASVVGDAPTHLLSQTLHQQLNWLRETRQALQLNTSEYLQEEARLSIHPSQMNHFLNETDRLYQDTERLAARVKRLAERL